jgi:uncharacterized repeat protein (TIGR03803 family)
MNKRIWVGPTLASPFRLVIAAILLVLAGRAFNAGAQTDTILYSFTGSPNDGELPNAGLVQGSDGSFYGTTVGGGTNNVGTIFRISPGGSYTNLHSFVGPPSDGGFPYAALVQGSDGNFYGTTAGVGTYGNGTGTVFRISPSGSYTNLYSFPGYPTNGAGLFAGLMQSSDSNFYGTTEVGGTYNDGTVFRINPSGTYTTLYSFAGSPNDGAAPKAGLVQGSDGNFYGTTFGGGPGFYCGSPGCGTIFRISPSGSYTNLYSFGGSPNDGGGPVVGLVQGSDGNFYGTTETGGGASEGGTVFRISPTGTYTNLYSFGISLNDGYRPAGLVQGSDGNFYGTTSVGGASFYCSSGCGTIFRISPTGSYTNLYSFGSSSHDGSQPEAELVQGSDGIFYGTTEYGGTSTNCFKGCGTVFRLAVPLSPPPYPINQITSVHIAATNVVFSISSIAGETYQLQFSSSLNPTNWVNVPGFWVSNSIGALLTLTNFGGAINQQGFFRFAITP